MPAKHDATTTMGGKRNSSATQQQLPQISKADIW